jgi:ATPase subunit of ABC transporter with duplicated ATPase domains
MKTAKMKEEQKQQETIAVPEITDKIEKLDIQSEDPSAAERSDQKSQEEEIEDIAKNKRKTEPAETTTPLLAPAKEEEEEPITLPNIISQCNKDEYLVKTIDWQDKKVRIITQNGNALKILVSGSWQITN